MFQSTGYVCDAGMQEEYHDRYCTEQAADDIGESTYPLVSALVRGEAGTDLASIDVRSLGRATYGVDGSAVALPSWASDYAPSR